VVAADLRCERRTVAADRIGAPDGSGPNMTLRVGVLVSGRGTNLQALIDACADGRLDARIVYVASSRKQIPALERAAAAGIPAAAFPPAANGGREAAQLLMAARLRAEDVELVVLAGFDRILCDAFFARLGNVPVINIHPALLPAFGGMHGIAVHQAVLAAGVAETGATVHRAHAGQVDAGRGPHPAPRAGAAG